LNRKSDANIVPSGGNARRLSRRSLLAASAGMFAASHLPRPVAAQESSALAPSGLTAQSVYAFDATTNVLLYSQNPNERLAIGSLVKVATALVVVDTISDLNEQVLIDQTDTVDITVYSNMQLVAGDTLTVSLLLYGLLIPSGNDGGRALARYVGSKISGNDDPDAARDAFVARMNAFAKEQDLENTQFQNADGTDAKDTFSTAHDIAILFSLLMKNEKLAEIVSLPSYQGTSSGPEKRQYAEDTTNQLLGRSGVIGGKTGTTEEAGACVALARQLENGNIVIMALLGADAEYDANSVIVAGSDKRWEDADKVIADMDEKLSWIAPPDETAFPGLEAEMNVWQVETKDQAAVPLRVGGQGSMYQLVLGSPVSAGEEAGKVDLYYGEIQLGSFPVYQAG
jgi:D-alanyl-D-alanine carboxypeptidase (penicillin-binding protein 5/6)